MMENAIKELNNYVNSLGNHKLERANTVGSLIDKTNDLFVIVRRNKKYSFGISFLEIEKFGFKPVQINNYGGKDEILIKYMGN